MRVLVIGTNHHNTLSMVRCLGEAGYQVDLIYRGSSYGYVTKSKYIRRVFAYKKTDNLISVLKDNYNNIEEMHIIITCDDYSTRILNEHYEEMKGHFDFFHTKKYGELIQFQDKSTQIKLAEEIGCNVPITKVYSGQGHLTFSTYPCLIKPIESIRGGKKISICQSQEELNSLIETFADGNRMLVSQLLSKDYEIVILGLSWSGQIIIPGFIRKIRDNKGGTTFSKVLPISEMDCTVVSQSERMIKAIGYEGLFGIEFIKNSDGYYFIEINLRNDATCYSLAIAGANLPVAYVQAVLGYLKTLTNSNVTPIHSMVELNDFKFVLKRQVSFRTWLKQLKTSECLFYYSKKDKKPFYYAILSIIMRPIYKH